METTCVLRKEAQTEDGGGAWLFMPSYLSSLSPSYRANVLSQRRNPPLLQDLFMTLRLTLSQKYVNGTNKEVPRYAFRSCASQPAARVCVLCQVVKLFVDHYNKMLFCSCG